MLDMRSPKAKCQCPTCGSELLLDELTLPPILRRILKCVQRHGQVMPEILWDAIWGSEPNGGPVNRNALSDHIKRLNRLIEPYGVSVRRPRTWGAPYRLVQIAEAAQ
jgi:hypothetical protein